MNGGRVVVGASGATSATPFGSPRRWQRTPIPVEELGVAGGDPVGSLPATLHPGLTALLLRRSDASSFSGCGTDRVPNCPKRTSVAARTVQKGQEPPFGATVRSVVW